MRWRRARSRAARVRGLGPGVDLIGAREVVDKYNQTTVKPRDLMNVTLAGLPELELFPSDDARRQAFREISDKPDRPKKMVVASTLVVAAMFAVASAAQWLLTALGAPKGLAGVLLGLALAVTLAFSIRALHRRVMGHELRLKLLEAGVAICVKCGYALRGLPTDSTRCPECGRGLSDRARELIRP